MRQHRHDATNTTASCCCCCSRRRHVLLLLLPLQHVQVACRGCPDHGSSPCCYCCCSSCLWVHPQRAAATPASGVRVVGWCACTSVDNALLLLQLLQGHDTSARRCAEHVATAAAETCGHDGTTCPCCCSTSSTAAGCYSCCKPPRVCGSTSTRHHIAATDNNRAAASTSTSARHHDARMAARQRHCCIVHLQEQR